MATPDEVKRRRVLLCGGPADGQWVDVPEREYSVHVANPLRLDITAWLAGGNEAAEVPFPEIVDYRIRPMPLQFHSVTTKLWVGVPIDLYAREADEAAIKAVFQRDVARQILGAR